MILSLALALLAALPLQEAPASRRLPLATYRDRMVAGWIGQMVGVGWGGPTEFRWQGKIMPAEEMPAWTPEMVNQFAQDDIYVEMTFLRTLEEHGLDATARQAGIDFAASEYPLWHANRAGRDNLRAGIAPPDSGHPRFNRHADDIDYQIESDFAGLIAPGLPNTVIELGERFGRLMNYGDGLYAGQFVGGMVAEAFFASDPARTVTAGLECIPAESEYAACIRDVVAWHAETPEDWTAAWERLEAKWSRDRAHRRASCSPAPDPFNIDAKLNGAYAVLGLLYGERDPERTIAIATRAGQDSDCNPSTAAGVLFTTIGSAALPDRFTSALDRHAKFSHTPYDFERLTAVCEALARQAVVRAGGRIERDDAGEEVLVIPILPARPSALERTWKPGPVAGARFAAAEWERIPPLGGVDLAAAIARFAPDWEALHCGPHEDPGLRESWGGRAGVLVTHPWSDSLGCVLRRTADVPAAGRTVLHLVAGHDPRGDWTLVIRADGKELRRLVVGPLAATDGWLALDVDLSPFAGQSVELELGNEANGWSWETGYWGEIAIVSR
ncbi:MAG: ADP-ribosylglycohydrolase family protein [Planctomycetota bacterium]